MELFLILIIFLVLIFLFIFLLVLAGYTVFDLFLPAPFVSSKKEVVRKMIKIAQIKKGDKVFDLGSGDGRLVIEAAKAGALAAGVEKNPFLVLFSKIKARLADTKAKIIWGDIFDQNLGEADIIFLYLNKKLLAKLAPKLKEEARLGAKIISNTYGLSSFTLTKKFDNIRVYIIGAKH